MRRGRTATTGGAAQLVAARSTPTLIGGAAVPSRRAVGGHGHSDRARAGGVEARPHQPTPRPDVTHPAPTRHGTSCGKPQRGWQQRQGRHRSARRTRPAYQHTLTSAGVAGATPSRPRGIAAAGKARPGVASQWLAYQGVCARGCVVMPVARTSGCEQRCMTDRAHTQGGRPTCGAHTMG